MNIGGIGAGPEISKPQASPNQDTTALEVEIETIRNKLKSLKDDMRRFSADRSKDGKGIDEKIKKLQQAYDKLSAELSAKQSQLSQMKQSKTQVEAKAKPTQKTDGTPQNGKTEPMRNQDELNKLKQLFQENGNFVDVYI